ncbi:ATP-binding protein [Schleiferia thermophila]|uniref:ATP-binding protein n=1 Tax=Schleiferia thermophila TaxID=884107 RepID=UPI003EEEA3DE
MNENIYIDKKKLDAVTGRSANWNELAKDCVCFANTRGGKILIGIADKEHLPPPHQRIDEQLPYIIQKKIAERTINVATKVEIKTASNGGQFIELEILFSASTIASTTDGRYYYRSGDTCVPLLPDELSRLFSDKPAFVWETRKTKIPVTDLDPIKFDNFKKDITQSSRVSVHVKNKSDEEILDHYFFAVDGCLTNLGVLWVGKRNHRANLLYAPTIHFLKFDEYDQKVNKILWEDHSLNPKELIEAVWTQIPDWKEGVDIADGMFRKFIPNYEEEVVRELLVNALVHRPYTTRGDIFIYLFPDRLEVINPGLFPIGVTPQNVLHKNIRRNPYLAQVFYDLNLMDKEGSGIDKMYEVLLTNGKPLPVPYQGDDYVKFTVERKIVKPEIISLINRADEMFQLKPKEIISLGIIAQYNALSAIEFAEILNLPDTPNVVTHWLGRLPELGLIQSKGKTKGKEYFINPDFLKKANFKGKTNLKRIENHRLEELIFQDVKIYGPTSIGDIHTRIGKEINIHKIRRTIHQMMKKKVLVCKGEKRHRKYFIPIEQN